MPRKTEEEIQEFLQYMNNKCHVTWRVARTYLQLICRGVRKIYSTSNICRCQSSNTRIRETTENPHPKHTDCKVKMYITIKRTGHRCRLVKLPDTWKQPCIHFP